jgi:hypothetical protein
LDGACARRGRCPCYQGQQLAARASGSSGVGAPVGGGHGSAKTAGPRRHALFGWVGRGGPFPGGGPASGGRPDPRYPAAPILPLAGSVLDLHALPPLHCMDGMGARRTRPARATAGSFSADLAKWTRVFVFTHAAASAAPTSGEDPCIAGLARRKLVAIDRLRFF